MAISGISVVYSRVLTRPQRKRSFQKRTQSNGSTDDDNEKTIDLTRDAADSSPKRVREAITRVVEHGKTAVYEACARGRRMFDTTTGWATSTTSSAADTRCSLTIEDETAGHLFELFERYGSWRRGKGWPTFKRVKLLPRIQPRPRTVVFLRV